MRSGKSRQQWFTTDSYWETAEGLPWGRVWLKCGNKEAKREKRREYVEKRRTYKKAVGRAKRSAEESKQMSLKAC